MSSTAVSRQRVGAVSGSVAGYAILLVATLSVTVLLQQIAARRGLDAVAAPNLITGSLPGFSAARWYLPDDALWGFVEIPAGSFIMGSDPALDPLAYRNERWSNRQRQGEVELPRYFIARHETTRAQFAAYVRDSGVPAKQIPLAADGSLPVTDVTWPEVLAYSRWLDRQLRQSADTPPVLRAMLDAGAVVTLPDEAEWEKAARGTDGRIFPWRAGRDRSAESLAHFNAPGPRPVTGVACTPCAWGLSDMAGNVWELTRSPLRDYPFVAGDAAGDLAADALHVMRGGSYAESVNHIRAAVRGGVDPGVRSPAIGFRLVISTR